MQVSFGAKLKQNEAFAIKVPKRFDKEELLALYRDYKKFLKEDKITSAILPDSEIMLSTKQERGAYAINMDIFEHNKKEPIQIPISISNGAKPHFDLNSLKFQTYLYAAYKTGVKPRMFETSHKYIKRAFMEYFSKK